MMERRVPNVYSKLPSKKKNVNNEKYLQRANKYVIEGNHPMAYKFFIQYFENLECPSLSSENVQRIFTNVVINLGIILEETDVVEELLKCCIQALNMFPKNYIILTYLGSYLFKIGELEIASRYLEAAIKSNNTYLPAEKYLLYVKWNLFPRWHFRMMNDRKRNVAYYKAIKLAIADGHKRVIDIGAGCGLLSLMAASCGAQTVTAIEENKILYNICSKVVNIYEQDHIINTINENSNSLVNNCKVKYHLLVTEIFDVALFGERAIDTLIHALLQFTEIKNFKVIPASGSIYLTGIQSKELFGRCRYVRTLKELNLVDKCIRMVNTDIYDAEHLQEKQVQYITETKCLFNVNFSDVECLIAFRTNAATGETIELKGVRDGIIHALVVWFTLDLGYGIQIATNPHKPNCASSWEQAIFYLDHPIYLQKDQILRVNTVTIDNQLKLSVASEFDGNCPKCLLVSKDIISFLNDEKLVECILKLSETYPHGNNTKNIIDFNVFPLLGLLLAKKGWIVFHVALSPCDLEFLNYVLDLNGISRDTFNILGKKDIYQYYYRMLETTDVAYVDAIHMMGSLNQFPLDKFNKFSGIMVPKKIFINIMLINSAYLYKCNKLDENKLLYNKIADVVNEYMGSEHIGLEKLDYCSLSEPKKVELLYKGFEKSVKIKVTHPGKINGLYFWYDMIFAENIKYSTLTSTYYKKCCTLIETPLEVKVGDTVSVKVRMQEFHMKIELE